MSRNEFSVVQFFIDGSYEKVCQFVSSDKAVRIVGHYITSVGAKIGTTNRVIITDGGDCICFEWIRGQGIVFPPPDGEQKK